MARQAFFQSPPPQGEITLIVLGGKVTGGQPSTVLRNRLETAAAYLLANPQARCVVAGGQGPDEDYPEAVVMAAYLERRGIARERILLEAASTNTRENLRFSGALIADKEIPVAIVSDSFHQLRASIYARAEGLQPYSLSSYTPWGLFPSYWIRDMFGVIAAWVETRIATQP